MEAARRIDDADAALTAEETQRVEETAAFMKDEMATAVNEVAADRERRLAAAAHSDAFTVVSRARQRAGGDPAHWAPHEAEIARRIADMLLLVQNQGLAPIEAGMLRRTDRAKLATAAEVGAALREKDA
jgi:hypothetical protein